MSAILLGVLPVFAMIALGWGLVVAGARLNFGHAHSRRWLIARESVGAPARFAYDHGL